MIELKNIEFSFGNDKIFDNYSLDIEQGSIVALMGASGCGKTTLLRIIAGLEQPRSGTVSGVGDYAYMFQEQRLLPWYSAKKNVSCVLNGKDADLIAEEYLRKTGFSESMDKKPFQLSGGQRQRVSLARTFAYGSDKQLVLLDEPLNALDDNSKDDIIEFIQGQAISKTVIMVTHDKEEAMKLANRIIEIKDSHHA